MESRTRGITFKCNHSSARRALKKNATKEGKEKKLRLHALKEGVPHLKGYKSVVCFKDECQTEHDLGSEPQSRRLVNCYNLKTATGTQNGGSDGN